MAKYGLQRGIEGSEARHIDTTQYYREMKVMTDTLKANVTELQKREAAVQEELARAKKRSTDRETERGSDCGCNQYRRKRRFSFRKQQDKDAGKGEYRPASGGSHARRNRRSPTSQDTDHAGRSQPRVDDNTGSVRYRDDEPDKTTRKRSVATENGSLESRKVVSLFP